MLTIASDEIIKSAKLKQSGIARDVINTLPTRENDKSEAILSAAPPAEDYGPDIPDDEEGRFFGGGVTQEENEILNYIDEQTSTEVVPEKFDLHWLRKKALKFEKCITKNAELRAKFEDEPQKFMNCEADLHAEIKALGILCEHPELYGEIVKLGCLGSLVTLLTHENTDIVIDVVEIINELTDENVEAEQSQWNEIVDSMIEADLLNLLASNLKRFNEDIETERNGVYYLLSILENLASVPSLAERIGEKTTILSWLVDRIRKNELPINQNRQYAAEVLAILLQSSSHNAMIFCEMDGTNIFLELLAHYRRRDPLKGTEEEEFFENLFDALTCVVNTTEGKAKFVEAEGVELCLIMIREGKMSKSRALRLLDHSMSSLNGKEICERLIEAGGLKTIFGMFMKRQDSSNTEHLLGIFSSLLRLLPADSAHRIRTLAKFVEKDYEKIYKLIELRKDYALRVSKVDNKIQEEKQKISPDNQQTRADEWLSSRLDAGLFCLHSIDVLLAWLVAEDDGASQKVKELLAQRDETLGVLSESLNGMSASLVIHLFLKFVMEFTNGIRTTIDNHWRLRRREYDKRYSQDLD